MPQNDATKKPRSIREMLEGKSDEMAPGAQDVQKLQEALQQKEVEVAQYKQELEKQQVDEFKAKEFGEPEPEKAPEAVPESVETMEGKEAEAVPEREQVEAPGEPVQKKKPVKQKKQKRTISDDVATIAKLDEPKKVKALVFLALKRGVFYAFDVAKGLNDPYLLDEFHDTLVDEMYDVFCEKQKIVRCQTDEDKKKAA
ncbi:hypothetical protein KKH43_06000 [Patescibacteria group bacterium]|nr:hypothetical protein [Patescibacteria group bacterium]